MGRDAIKAGENPCFQCRKEAAKYNDKLNSREGAAEMLGVSVSSLADYELSITKVIPVDKVVLMAELYNAPELKAWYTTGSKPHERVRRGNAWYKRNTLGENDPRGILCKPCPVCGYEYGSGWQKVEVPQEVIDWLMALPDTEKKPAWV